MVSKKRNLLFILISAAVIIVSFIVFFNGFDSSQKKPNVVIILVDTLRADHCSLYGYRRNTTPNLKRIAAKGLKLENHFANSPWTKPSVASIITGLLPTAHGSRIGQFEDLKEKKSPLVEVLNPGVKTLAETLKENGYSTHAFLSNWHLTPKFGYAQGYDDYYLQADWHFEGGVWKLDKKLMHSTAEVLEKNKEKGKPVFIWCHLMSVHDYCSPTDSDKFLPERSTPIPKDAAQIRRVKDYDSIEKAVCDYDASILYVDRLVGELFDFIVTHAPNTIFIVTSDHGEEFYEHGGFDHSRTLYNEILRVPGVIWGPGVPTGVMTHMSDSIDLLPTILTYLGIDVDSDLKGSALFRGNNICREKEKEVFAEQHHFGHYKRFTLIRDGKKMIINRHKKTGEEIFEFYGDALDIEKKNIFDSMGREMVKQFKQIINRYKKENILYFKRKIGKRQYKNLDKEDIQRLRSLGYIE